MKSLIAFCSIIFFTAHAFAGTVHFDNVPVGGLPSGWLAGVTGPGNADWSVVRDDSAPSKPNVLKQAGAVASHSYPWCVKCNVSLKDGHVQVSFKPIAGKEDQGGGLIWRWQDGDNYYVARANALEDNVTIYHTIAGVRKECGRAPMKVASNQWHTLRVDFHETHFVVSFDGSKTLEWDDATFKKPGAVGVWTKADSIILFDDFSYGSR